MAGKITVSTINDSSGVLATQNGMTGIAKAWVNFNGGSSSPTIRASFNVSSLTYNSTGDYTINFTTAMPNADYSVAGLAGTPANSSDTGLAFSFGSAITPLTTTSVRVSSRNTNTGTNSTYVCVMVIGN